MGQGRVADSPRIRGHRRINSNLKRRLKDQWVDAVEDWIGQDQSVRTDMLDSWMLNAIGDLVDRRVIDIGCGEGRFCRLLASLGAETTGVDLTEGLIEEALQRASGGETYLVGNAEDLADIDDESFDIAVSYIVLVDLDDYRASITAAWRVLKPGGRFIVCNIHPMRTASSNFTGWIRDYERKLFYPLDNYTEEGPREFHWWGKTFINMHRTLSSYIMAFLDAGFLLEGLHEPTPSKEQLAENPHFDDEFRAPNFIIYELRKPAN
ncbi:MAG: class I SAM-dependent methyltransferase [Chloroflexi bacterium]|nr:class I SAM-dependent methyltransferase [Chloroflexota bacterium]MCY3939368.1 class I SAM-dependent methyltransferase [Chloroflexota bacterium]